MPHVSRHKVQDSTKRELEDYIASFLADTGSKARQNIFRELLTPTERLMIAKRLAMLYFISKNVPTHRISQTLRVSPSTVARFETAVGAGAYSNIILWINRHSKKKRFLDFISELIAIPFEARHTSISKFMNERYHGR